jgi:hypothetical protein
MPQLLNDIKGFLVNVTRNPLLPPRYFTPRTRLKQSIAMPQLNIPMSSYGSGEKMRDISGLSPDSPGNSEGRRDLLDLTADT